MLGRIGNNIFWKLKAVSCKTSHIVIMTVRLSLSWYDTNIPKTYVLLYWCSRFRLVWYLVVGSVRRPESQPCWRQTRSTVFPLWGFHYSVAQLGNIEVSCLRHLGDPHSAELNFGHAGRLCPIHGSQQHYLPFWSTFYNSRHDCDHDTQSSALDSLFITVFFDLFPY